MKKLIIMVSADTSPFSMVGNAIGHMMVGIAPRIPKGFLPSIEIFVATKEIVRAFRSAAYDLYKTAGDEQVLFSDFAHTTTQGTAIEHQAQTVAVKEQDIHYFAACICSDEENLAGIHSIPSVQSLKSSSLDKEPLADQFLPPVQYLGNEDFLDNCYEKRFAIVLAQDLDVEDALNLVARSVLLLCQGIDLDHLRLHCYSDADGSLHPGMSEYGLVVLEARKPNALLTLENNLADTPLKAKVIYQLDKIVCAAFFGSSETSKLLTKRDIKLWSKDCHNTAEEKKCFNYL